MDIEKSTSEHYRSESGERYAAHYQSDPHWYGYNIDAAQFKPHLMSSDDVLDFGCGNGGIALCLQSDVASIEGVEVNTYAARTAREAGIDVYESTLALPEGRRYDVVLSNHVLEHVRDPVDILQTCRELLKPSGRLLLKLPLDDWREKRQRQWKTRDIDRHLYGWTPRLLSNLLDEAGYEVKDMQIVVSAWHPKLFGFEKAGLGRPVRWLLAVLKRRRQLFVVATPKRSKSDT